jgi:hypothetical protein
MTSIADTLRVRDGRFNSILGRFGRLDLARCKHFFDGRDDAFE